MLEVASCCPSVAERAQIIFNPVASAAQIDEWATMAQINAPTSQGESWLIVGIGRLSSQKGFDLLIDAAAQLPATANWHIDIYGDGPERAALQQRIIQHGLQDRVTLCGYTDQPHEILKNADIFVLPSRHEGFGLVIVEAMMHGVQIVSADCPHGPRELLEGGRLGELVAPNNPSALAQGLTAVMSGKVWVTPSRLQQKAREFSIERSASQWLALLKSLGD